MKCRMTFLHRHKNTAAGRTNFSATTQRSFDCSPIAVKFDDVR